MLEVAADTHVAFGCYAASHRHAIGTQEIEARETELERVEAEYVGDFRIEIGLLARERMVAERGIEPVRHWRLLHQHARTFR